MMIFSRVVKSRFEIGSSSSFTFFPAPLIDFCPFPFDPSSGEVKDSVGPVMARMRYHRTFGPVDYPWPYAGRRVPILSYFVLVNSAVAGQTTVIFLLVIGCSSGSDFVVKTGFRT